ncbi:MAG: hypothetical protein RL358_1294 [Pseudomonadota bacterium]
MLLSLYARKEPTTDSVSIMFGFKKKLDVVLYKDRECTKPEARWRWDLSNCPRHGQKTAMYNCCRWNLVWVN